MNVILFFLALFTGALSSGEYSECQTPSNETGVCKPIKDCYTLFTIYQNTPISSSNRQLLRNSSCDKPTKFNHVCCKTDDTKPQFDYIGKLKSMTPQPPFCGADAPKRIHGGTQTRLNEFPWTVLLRYEKQDESFDYHCGGSLINERYVLTAAHCVLKVDSSWNLTSVRLGEWDRTTDPDCELGYCAPPAFENSIVGKILTHPDYKADSRNQHHDIALLRLARRVKANSFVKPICLPLDASFKDMNYTGFSYHIAGWGQTETAASSDKKLKISGRGRENYECDQAYAYQGRNLIEKQLCVGGDVKGEDSCQGDSGGPLMRYKSDGNVPYWFLAGIVSYGDENCASKQIPAVYTKVYDYLEWIAENIKD